MNKQTQRAIAQSLVWNIDTRDHACAVSTGADTSGIEADNEGWFRVGRYAAGYESAHVQANKLRKRFTNLETDVRTPDNRAWKAEVWVRRKDAEA